MLRYSTGSGWFGPLAIIDVETQYWDVVTPSWDVVTPSWDARAYPEFLHIAGCTGEERQRVLRAPRCED